MNKSMRIARHVYLRTQQRRLRHVKRILIRNLTLPRAYLKDPLRISVFFTIHVSLCPDKVLFQSDPVKDTYNPSWESVQLSRHGLGHHQSFTIRVWVTYEDEEEEEEEGGKESCLTFERKVELFDLSYLGLMVNKDGSSYPPNSVVVGMYEGLYSRPEVGGVPCPPQVVHTLTDYLPPQSLLEVPKKEVVDSYHQPVLTRILGYQEELNTVGRHTRFVKARVEHYLQLEREFFEKRGKKERLITRLKLFRTQLQELEAPEKKENDELEQVTRQADEAERSLVAKQMDLQQKWEHLRTATAQFTLKKEQMLRCKRNRHLRQRHMVHELASTFLIRERSETFTICNVILPNADQLEQPTRIEQLGVALGYVAHLIHHLGKIMFIPLLYPIQPQGSKSVICDLVSEETLIDNIKEFPLYAKGSEKALFQYAVFLLNKDIAQVRQHCGYGTSKTMFKQTLPNLKFLLERLTRDIRAMLRGNNHSAGFHSPHTLSDATSITSSYVSVEASLASVPAISSLQSPETNSLGNCSIPASHISSLYPSTYNIQMQHQLLHQDSTGFSPKSDSPDLAESNHLIVSTLRPYKTEQAPQPDDPVRVKNQVTADDDETATPLADRSTKEVFTKPLDSVHGQEDEHSRASFFADDTQPHEEEEGEEELGIGGGMLRIGSADSSTGSQPSLSSTPIVSEHLTVESQSADTPQSYFARTTDVVEMRETLPNESLTELSSSDLSQTGHLEETLKSAMQVTQVLLGHTPPEHIEIEPVPIISTTNDATIESTQALLDLTAASLTGNVVPETQEEKPPEDASESVHTGYVPPQGPPMIPDSFELSSLTTRQSRGDTRHASDDNEQEFDFSEHSLQLRARASAYSAFSLDNVGYVKTGMATPHRVGSSAAKEEERGSGYQPMNSRRMASGNSDESRQSLADFIDRPSGVRRGPQSRLKQRGPNKIGSRGRV